MTEAVPAAPATPKVLSRVEQLVNDLWDDAELGPKVRAKAKEKWPETRIPEDQVNPLVKPLEEKAAALQARIDAMEKEQKDREKAAAEAQGQKDMEARLDAARKKYALTDEGFDKMVSRMKETQNYLDAEAAAAWVTDNNPPPKPTSGPTWATKRVDIFGRETAGESLKRLHSDPDRWVEDTIGEVLREAPA